MVYQPSNQLPIWGPDDDQPWPSPIQQPITTRRIIDATQQFFDTTKNPDAAGDAIMNYYSASIANFVSTQRRNYGRGINQVHSRFLQYPGMLLQYENNHGMERLSITVKPESFTGPGGQLLDFNQDGYIAFILYDPNFPNTLQGVQGYPKSYDLYVNGYRVKQGFEITGVATGFVVMFGLTALRCQSLVDPNNPLRGIQVADEPSTGLFPKVQPPRAQVSGHDDVFVYNLFNFTTNRNPNYTAQILGEFNGKGQTPINVNITGGIQFFDPAHSPLNTTKGNSVNYFGVALSYGLVQITADPIGYFMIAEFYSRKKQRAVTQSWNKLATPGGSIVANDKPLYWGNTHVTSYTSLIPGQNGLGFDLYGDEGGAGTALAPVPIDGGAPNNAAPFASALSSADAQALSQYNAEVNAIELAFEAQMIGPIEQAIAQVDSTFNTLNNAEYQLVQANAAVAEDQVLIQLYLSQDNPIAAQAQQQQLARDQQSVTNFTNNVAQDQAAYNNALAQLGALEAQKPNLPPAPQLSGDNLDKFKYREVYQGWSVGSWQGGT